MTPGPQVAQDQELFRLGHRLDQLDNEARKYNRLSQERVAIEDERMKVWTRFRVLYEKLKGIREDHGMGYGHNVSTPGDQNTMNKPTVGPLYEYEKPETRKSAVQSRDTDDALKLIFQLVKTGAIKYDEFEDLLVELIHKVMSHLK